MLEGGGGCSCRSTPGGMSHNAGPVQRRAAVESDAGVGKPVWSSVGGSPVMLSRAAVCWNHCGLWVGMMAL